MTDIKTILIMNAIFSKVGDFLSGLSTMLLSLVTLSILAEVLFGIGVFGANVVENVMKLITMLGDGGFVGLIALLILWSLFNKDK
jgi:cellobiose-specific phosphotransferase system component IIC|tara:strand:+ start:1689 stop:1943 length:255 start_codon:yes stop_codon:yes gene_type:complete